MKRLFRTKPLIGNKTEGTQLRKCLTALDLTFLGIGAIIGAGIFVLTGIAAATQAGPAIVLSFLVAGLACSFTALSYAELASSIGGAGSAYTYSYVALGEFPAWIIGWDLLLEYSIAVSAVAVGWSEYFNNILMSFGLHLPEKLLNGPLEGGIFNLPAFLIVFVITLILIIGVKASAKVNTSMVLVKLAVIGLFIIVAAMNINPDNWHPFMPFGWKGVMGGAALIFFSYIGFDAVSTSAEEVINPKRDLPIGIIASLIISTILYILVSGLLTGIAPYQTLNESSPISYVLLNLNYRLTAGIIAVGALAGLTTVILVMYYGLTRVFLAIARDNLLPSMFSTINPKTRTPVRIIALSGVIIGFFSAFIPISDLAELVNIGTLSAFIIVCVGVIVLRYTKPNMIRPFKTPFAPLIPALGAILCFYLIISLPVITWIRFALWMGIGIVLYFTYGRFHSTLNNKKKRI